MSSIFIYIFIFVNYLCIRYNSFVFGKALYLVKFEDFPEEDNEWLPITSLQGCLEMVYQFDELLDRAELQNSEPHPAASSVADLNTLSAEVVTDDACEMNDLSAIEDEQQQQHLVLTTNKSTNSAPAAVVESSQINETKQELGKNKLLIGLNAELGLFGR